MNICLHIKQKCTLCDNQSSFQPICNDCLNDLPQLSNPCLCCAIDLPVTSKYQYCKDCITAPPHYEHTIAAFNYRFPINLIIPLIKHEQHKIHLRWLADSLAATIKQHPRYAFPQALIPVPISKLKRFKKGYNQTETLAIFLSNSLNITIENQLVTKTRDTTAQAQLNAKERKKNLNAAFSVVNNNYKHLAIVDDVMTTGATASEIAKALKATGVEKVDLWVLARTPI